MNAQGEFRGTLNGKLYVFPLQWVDNIKAKDGVITVCYYDETQYDPETGAPLVEIQVDEFDIK